MLTLPRNRLVVSNYSRQRGVISMMPLIMADAGVSYQIKRIGGEGTQRQFIEGLGFVPGAEVVIISKNADNLIVGIKGSRVAINKDVALKVLI